MDPEPTANPHAKLVIVSFQECPALQTPAWEWSPTTLPDWVLVKGLGWRGARESAADEGEDHSQESNVVDVWIGEGCEESEQPPSSQGCPPGLAGHVGDLVAQKQETAVVEDMIKWDLVRGCTLPSLKELGLDIYVEKRDKYGSWSVVM